MIRLDPSTDQRLLKTLLKNAPDPMSMTASTIKLKRKSELVVVPNMALPPNIMKLGKRKFQRLLRESRFNQEVLKLGIRLRKTEIINSFLVKMWVGNRTQFLDEEVVEFVKQVILRRGCYSYRHKYLYTFR